MDFYAALLVFPGNGAWLVYNNDIAQHQTQKDKEMSDQEIINQALAILESRLQIPEHTANAATDTVNYLKLQYAGLEHESFRVMFLNQRHELIQTEELSRGTIDSAAIYPREVVKATLQFNAAAVILSHNHPSGNSDPSHADRDITQHLVDALNLIDVRVLDHIIIGGDNSYSFAEHGLV
ncbi:MAG: JAB domain-containing protein [Cellvibrionaceae bacterium]